MADSLVLLPAPRRLTLADGSLALTDQRLILLDDASPQTLRPGAMRWQQALNRRTGRNWELVASPSVPWEQVALHLRLRPDQVKQHQGYELTIAPERIVIEAHDAPGAFYGLCTLAQIVEQSGTNLPCLRISDWPDFPVRGVMWDVSRDKVPTLASLLALVDLLAGWKINHLQLYTEHAFAYRRHPEVWAEASPLTGQDILDLDAYCQERFVELVPNQNSFGHMQRWLKHPRYLPLAEVTGRFKVPWGAFEGPYGLCPLDPGSLDLLRGMYDELLPHFSSRLFNVGCDETFDLGQGRSQDECASRGKGRVYLEFLLKIHAEVAAHNRRMMFWGDIIMQHADLVAELPKDAVALEWGYEANHPFASHGERFAAAGLQFYVCPGTSSWCSIAGRTQNALGNLLNAAENGLQRGAAGYLITDWGDLGHWQALPVSYLGLASGAAYAWALEANRTMDVAQAVSLHAFGDRTSALGRVAYDLGDVYRQVGVVPHNSSALFWIMQEPVELLREKVRADAAALHRTLQSIDQALQPLARSQSVLPDAGLIMREFAQTARLLRHACHRGLFALGSDSVEAGELDSEMRDIIHEYRQVWLARNRPGGLADSVARLERARADYGR